MYKPNQKHENCLDSGFRNWPCTYKVYGILDQNLGLWSKKYFPMILILPLNHDGRVARVIVKHFGIYGLIKTSITKF